MKPLLILAILFFTLVVEAQQRLNIVPVPAELKTGKGHFNLNAATVFVLEGSGLENTAAYFNAYLLKYYGFTLKTATKKRGNNEIILNFERFDYPLPRAYNWKYR